MKIMTKYMTAALALCVAAMSSCLDDGNKTIILEGAQAGPVTKPDEPGNLLNVPDDADAGENPVVIEPTVTLPGVTPSIDVVEGVAYATLHLTGIYDQAAGEWLRLYGTNDRRQNVWLSVDGDPKGIAVTNVADQMAQYTPVSDVVFLIDNSQSMGEEADAIAAGILEWAEGIKKLGIDMQVGCVGYGGDAHAICGALNLTTPQQMSKYLDHGTGIDRTKHFGGSDAQALMAAALGSDGYENGVFNECGVLAMRFAADNFAFRPGANRIYINFTDEANQPNGDANWSVEYLNPDNGNWTAADGTVHTVYSGNQREWHTPLYEESPWLMSTYTGGSVIYTDPDFKGFSLHNLPVTGALQNSYLIRFGNITRYLDGQPHRVRVTVYDAPSDIKAERVYDMIFKNK